jgi:prolyl-tRNA synthetase
MSKKKLTGITPTRSEDYAEWYQNVIQAAGLAEHATARGCMIIKPWGFGIWEKIQQELDFRIKKTGAQNVYFPLLIPLSSFQKEAKHVAGFAKECAVVTHHRLEVNEEGHLVPAGELEEPLIIRPTSEMVIGEALSSWVQSHRDLPIQLNQWCNIVRWEMRTRLFLRTSEFLWQEGHTFHAIEDEAHKKAIQMWRLYGDFCREWLSIPMVLGEKTESERFPGAVATYTIEAMMQDRKAIQGGTSHFLGQNFARACNIQYQSISGEREFVWTSSWGATTRLIGALIMAHSDDDGLVLPPNVAPSHVVLIPLTKEGSDATAVLDYTHRLALQLREQIYQRDQVSVIVDEREMRGGEKKWDWIKKGVPIQIEIGLKEVESDRLTVRRRDQPMKESEILTSGELVTKASTLLASMQTALYERALTFRKKHTKLIDSLEAFSSFFEQEGGGFALCHWNRSPATEAMIKERWGVTIRCIPHDPAYLGEGLCPFSKEPSPSRVLFARNY